MSLLPDVVGNASPRLALEPSGEWSDADDASFLSSSYGLKPDAWQHQVLQAWMQRRADGKWAALTCGLSVPRQNGKNGVLEMRELFGMVLLGEKFLHTAHEVKTARKAFLRLRSFFDNPRQYPELAELVLEIRRTNGQEAIVLTNGGSVEFVARSSGSGRGFTVDTLVMDEAQDLGEDHLEALMPTTASGPLGNPQWIMTGTPPKDGRGAVFARTREDALAGGPRLAWHEWSSEPGVDLDDHTVWAGANPSLGIRLQMDVCEGERSRMSDDGFARERLGMWSTGSSQQVLSNEVWGTAADYYSVPDDRFALAIDVAPDLTASSVALAGLRPDGLWHVELDEARGGCDWVASYVADLLAKNPQVRAVVVDVGSPAKVIVDDLVQLNVKLTTPRVADVGAACGKFVDSVRLGQLKHTNQTQLGVALAAGRKRALGQTGLWAWNRKSADADITPLVACTLALWGAQNSTVTKPSFVRTGQRRTGTRKAVVM